MSQASLRDENEIRKGIERAEFVRKEIEALWVLPTSFWYRRYRSVYWNHTIVVILYHVECFCISLLTWRYKIIGIIWKDIEHSVNVTTSPEIDKSAKYRLCYIPSLQPTTSNLNFECDFGIPPIRIFQNPSIFHPVSCLEVHLFNTNPMAGYLAPTNHTAPYGYSSICNECAEWKVNWSATILYSR